MATFPMTLPMTLSSRGPSQQNALLVTRPRNGLRCCGPSSWPSVHIPHASRTLAQAIATIRRGRRERVSVVVMELHLQKPVEVMPRDLSRVQRAMVTPQQYGILYWDAFILSAAERAGCAWSWRNRNDESNVDPSRPRTLWTGSFLTLSMFRSRSRPRPSPSHRA